jgi:hypothetical protein
LTQHVTCSLNSSVQTAYIATYSVLYAYSTLYAAQNNVLSIPADDIKEDTGLTAEQLLQPQYKEKLAQVGTACYAVFGVVNGLTRRQVLAPSYTTCCRQVVQAALWYDTVVWSHSIGTASGTWKAALQCCRPSEAQCCWGH